ncbi:CoA-dependent acyltransferase [Polychaeton citri CBS 116435]|uniref:CoA-dependent acyltransferase n=1 Tax=Polychaeton citri CBS 116435 TaxID=1314669 RepID=A0A9P4UHU2_9PEZI|nr:CoA-dependent acyltransferase [Polychaeton citri CBS 116435]
MGLDSTGNVSILSPKEQKICNSWATVLNLDSGGIGSKRSFLSLGGDSIMAMQVVSACRAGGLYISVSDVLISQNIIELASRSTLRAPQTIVKAAQSGVPFDLSPIQRVHFLLSNGSEDDFGQKYILKLKEYIDFQKLEQAIEHIVKKHGMLRVRFSESKTSGWMQTISDDVKSSYRFRVTRANGLEENDEPSQTFFNIRRGPLLVVNVNIPTEGGLATVCLFCHHLVVDLVSWNIILADLEDFLRGRKSEDAGSISFQTLQFLHHRQIGTPDFRQPNVLLPCKRLPADLAYWGLSSRENTYGQTEGIDFELDEARTCQLLSGCHAALNSKPLDVLLGSLALSFSYAFPDRTVPTIFNESHGRDLWDRQIDLSRTVGWFTTLHPIHLPFDRNTSVLDAIRQAKDARHEAMKQGEAGVVQFDAIVTNDNSWCEVLFNFMGLSRQFERKEALWTREPGSGMDFGSTKSQRYGVFEISVIVQNNCAHFHIAYNRHMNTPAKIEKWSALWKHCLEMSIHSLMEAPLQYTLSDFPLVGFDYKELSSVVGRVTHGLEDHSTSLEMICPVLPIQRAMLLSQQKSPAYYHTQILLKCLSKRGPIDILRISEAWQSTVRQHAMLRTVFMEKETSPTDFYQIVLKDWKPKIVVLHNTAKLKTPTDVFGNHHLQEAFHPPHFLTIIEKDSTVYLYLEIDHTISDYSSVALYQRDLLRAYDGELQSRQARPFYQVPQLLAADQDPKGITYWREYLQSMPTQSLLPQLGSMNNPGTFLSETQEFMSPLDLYIAAQNASVTISTLIRLAWALTLHRRTNQAGVFFDYIVSGRGSSTAEVEDIAGPFITIIPYRQILRKTDGIKSLLQAIQQDFANGIEYQQSALSTMANLGWKCDTLVNCRKVLPSHTTISDRIQLDFIAEIDPFDYSIVLEIDEADGSVHTKLSYWSEKLSMQDARGLLWEFDRTLMILTQEIDGTVEDVSNEGVVMSRPEQGLDVQLECGLVKL